MSLEPTTSPLLLQDVSFELRAHWQHFSIFYLHQYKNNNILIYTRKLRHFIRNAVPVSNTGHVWDTSAHMNQPHPFLFLFETLQDTTDMGGTLIFYLFLVSIFNTYLVIFYLLLWILLLICILISKHHLLVMNSLYYPIFLLN